MSQDQTNYKRLSLLHCIVRYKTSLVLSSFLVRIKLFTYKCLSLLSRKNNTIKICIIQTCYYVRLV